MSVVDKYKNDFQTPPEVCKYMCGLIPEGTSSVLEPTPGNGNMLMYLRKYHVIYPKDNFFEMDKTRWFDCVVMNPPFSAKYAFGVPEHIQKYGMRLGYHILTECMQMSDNVIALMPWFTISDSDVRLRFLKSYGLISVTALPRKTFQYARIQTVVLQLQKGFEGETAFKVYDLLNVNQLKMAI